MTDVSHAGGAIPSRFFADLDLDKGLKDAQKTRPEQQAGIATYDQDSGIVRAFASFFRKTIDVEIGGSKTVLNVNSARAFLVRNHLLAKRSVEEIKNLSHGQIASILKEIILSNPKAKKAAIDYLQPTPAERKYYTQIIGQKLQIIAPEKIEGDKDQVLSFLAHLQGAGITIPKEKMKEWLKSEKDGHIQIPRSELDKIIRAAPTKEKVAEKAEYVTFIERVPEEIKTYIEGVRKIQQEKVSNEQAEPADPVHDDLSAATKVEARKEASKALREKLKSVRAQKREGTFVEKAKKEATEEEVLVRKFRKEALSAGLKFKRAQKKEPVSVEEAEKKARAKEALQKRLDASHAKQKEVRPVKKSIKNAPTAVETLKVLLGDVQILQKIKDPNVDMELVSRKLLKSITGFEREDALKTEVLRVVDTLTPKSDERDLLIRLCLKSHLFSHDPKSLRLLMEKWVP